MPAGGIARDRSFLTTFSRTAACLAASLKSRFWSERSAVFRRSSWQLTQYFVRTGWYDAALPGAAAACAAIGEAVCGAAAWTGPGAYVLHAPASARTSPA